MIGNSLEKLLPENKPFVTSSLACVVVNWNGADNIRRCLDSIRVSAHVSATVIVVDNGSIDGSPALVIDHFPGARLIRNETNLGFAKATNQGIQRSLDEGAQYVLLLNDDAFLSDDCLSKMLRAAESNPGAAIVSPRICDARFEEIIWYDGGAINLWGDSIHINMGKSVHQIRDAHSHRAVDFATGCCMLIRASVIHSVGFLDESYFAFSEDVDFSLRCRKAGYDILHVPSAVTWHFQSEDTKRNYGRWFRDYYVTRNKLLLMRKRMNIGRWLLFLLYFSLRHVVAPSVYFSITFQHKRTVAVFRGCRDFVLGKFGGTYV